MTYWVKVECPLCGEMAVAETHPNLKREWVGLTDEEIEIVSGDYTEAEGFKHGARWALDQLKEKNT